MKYINFGKIDRKFLIPILGGITLFIYKCIYPILPKFDILIENPFIINIYFSMGNSFAFIPYLILKSGIKKPISFNTNPNKLKEESKLNIELIYEDNL